MTTATANVAGQQLFLHPWRAAYWVEGASLLLADLHLGKATHFRRAGIAVPAEVRNVNIDKLIGLLLEFAPERVLFLGDLFHSDYNQEWDEFCGLLVRFPAICFELVKGNHDILDDAAYAMANLVVHEAPLACLPFLFSHHPMEAVPESAYNLAGHIHPSVLLNGRARQRLKLPCFYFGERNGILPAFGAFTGTAPIRPKMGDRVYVVAEEVVMEM